MCGGVCVFVWLYAAVSGLGVHLDEKQKPLLHKCKYVLLTLIFHSTRFAFRYFFFPVLSPSWEYWPTEMFPEPDIKTPTYLTKPQNPVFSLIVSFVSSAPYNSYDFKALLVRIKFFSLLSRSFLLMPVSISSSFFPHNPFLSVFSIYWILLSVWTLMSGYLSGYKDLQFSRLKVKKTKKPHILKSFNNT